jgi:hypothetical protein
MYAYEEVRHTVCHMEYGIEILTKRLNIFNFFGFKSRRGVSYFLIAGRIVKHPVFS